MTPLIMYATQRNDCAEATELLIDAGADIAAVDAKGKTALAYAREHGLARIQEVLLAHGAA
jgi:ankyrin repeat protein